MKAFFVSMGPSPTDLDVRVSYSDRMRKISFIARAKTKSKAVWVRLSARVSTIDVAWSSDWPIYIAAIYILFLTGSAIRWANMDRNPASAQVVITETDSVVEERDVPAVTQNLPKRVPVQSIRQARDRGFIPGNGDGASVRGRK